MFITEGMLDVSRLESEPDDLATFFGHAIKQPLALWCMFEPMDNDLPSELVAAFIGLYKVFWQYLG